MSSGRGKVSEKRQKTLLASMLLSAWAPLATGIAVLLSHSVTQFADFIRRTTEFFVLLLSWAVFRYLADREELTVETRKKWEGIVNLSVAFVMGLSGLVMLFLAIVRFQSFGPVGIVYPGLIIAVLGFIVNLWFWRRYKALLHTGHNEIIDSQRRLYLAKLFVDMSVILALGVLVFMPTHTITSYIDSAGSIAVSMYLFWSSISTLKGKGAIRGSGLNN